jgi:mannose-6-phosphate isomerase
MLYPLSFHPIYQERIWGGRNLERLFGRKLPTKVGIGESWEISDRPGARSVIANGPLAGHDLHWLAEHAQRELMGQAETLDGRFPLLVKILDAQEKLSLQVHPPAVTAKDLGGEPKTEIWYVVDAQPGAELYAGLKRGVTRTQFERGIPDGSVANCFHRLPAGRGDALFLPSGRVHAIGAGYVIFEIQQNSDTTYRVFDWNRVDSQGRRRELHVREALASIDFDDFEPGLIKAPETRPEAGFRMLTENPLFHVAEVNFEPGPRMEKSDDRPLVLAVISGCLKVEGNGARLDLGPGDFCLIPACVAQFKLDCSTQARLLWSRPA